MTAKAKSAKPEKRALAKSAKAGKSARATTAPAKSKKRTAATSGKAAKAAGKSADQEAAAEMPAETKEAGKKLVRASFLAQCFDVGERRIQQLSQEGVIKPEPGGKDKEGYKYDFAKSIIAIGRYYQKKADSRKSGGSEEMEKEKLLTMAIKRETEELKLAELKNDLYRTADIERVMGTALTRLRINLLAIPMGVAPLIRGKQNINDIAEIINERICRSLNETATLDIDKLIDEVEGLNQE